MTNSISKHNEHHIRATRATLRHHTSALFLRMPSSLAQPHTTNGDSGEGEQVSRVHHVLRWKPSEDVVLPHALVPIVFAFCGTPICARLVFLHQHAQIAGPRQGSRE